MKTLKDIFQELGISKVRLAKYLGVSRQMVYNYLELDDINKWPKEKKLLLFKLLDIQDGSDESFNSIKVNTEYLMAVENRLNQGVKNSYDIDNQFDLKGLSKEEQTLIGDIAYLIKEKFMSDNKNDETFFAIKYLYHLIQAMDNVPEIKYILGYMSKTTGFTKPEEYKFDEDKQFIFESILYTALTLYNNGGASKSKLIENHKNWVAEIEKKNEERLSRTQELKTIRVQALNELGYTEITNENAAEVFEKIAEIESRKV
ncbi:MAG: hypothetical protein J5892_04640 [Bacilli bacterium]|nr:hypothetical protein [Bacilli bacterium]